MRASVLPFLPESMLTSKRSTSPQLYEFLKTFITVGGPRRQETSFQLR